MVHAGHANALRQGKMCGDQLVVGLHTNADITTSKGRPLLSEVERRRMISSIRWVDEVVEGIPFGTPTDLLDKHKCDFCVHGGAWLQVVEGIPFGTPTDLLDKHKCDFCVHGDEFGTNGDGKDSYGEVKAAQRYIKCKRLDCISTTDIVERFHKALITSNNVFINKVGVMADIENNLESLRKETSEDARHIDFLEKAAAEGDFLIVGIQPDSTVGSCVGSGYPVMNLHERTLSVLACKYVSDVIMGAPFVVTSELMKHFQVDVVCDGMTPTETGPNGEDPFREPKRLGKFRVIDRGSELTRKMIIERAVQTDWCLKNET